MKNMKFVYKLLFIVCFIFVVVLVNGVVIIYDDVEVVIVLVDVFFNIFYVNLLIDGGLNGDCEQLCVKMGFLLNWLGMSFSK